MLLLSKSSALADVSQYDVLPQIQELLISVDGETVSNFSRFLEGFSFS
jgi:hypothetical protein